MKGSRRARRKAAGMVIWSLIFCGALTAQEIKPGQLIGSISARSDLQQTYAAYLPSTYAATRHWPVIFVFDPAARGALAVEVFRPGAEKHGFIVAASNTSRNGPFAPQLAAFQAVVDDLQARFPLDLSRIFTAGFSGGARVAVSLTRFCDRCIAGVIGAGAGFPPDMPTAVAPGFVYFGAVGLYDFNYFEMLQLQRALEQREARSHFEVFEGAHDWPPQEVASQAIAWLQLQAMAIGKMPRDEAFIADEWNTVVGKARQAERSAKAYDAWLAWKAAATDFRGLRDVSEAAAAAKRLRDSKALREAEKQLSRERARHEGLTARITALLTKLSQEPQQQPWTASELRSELADLKRQREKAQTAEDVAVFRRALGAALVQSVERGQQALRDNDPALAAICFGIAAEGSARPADLHYQAAAAYAQAGDRKQALQSLKKAIAAGYRDFPRMQTDPVFTAMRDMPEFRALAPPAAPQ